MKKNILSLDDLSTEQILEILDLAIFLKNQIKNEGLNSKYLDGKILGMIFQKPSTRTRISFETSMLHLGGNAINLSPTDLQLSRGESIEDTAKTISLYLDCLMARVYDHSDIKILSKYSRIPVINGLSDLFHPCQILADLLTIFEFKRKFHGLNVSYVGDGNNICNDLLFGCSKMGINLSISTPIGFEPLEWIVEIAKNNCKLSHGSIFITTDPIESISQADVVITDTFVSIGKENEREEREKFFLPTYQINNDIVKYAKDDYIFMHCLPAKRNKEVTTEILDGPHSVVWQEAENRLHVQKALLVKLLNSSFIET